METSHPADPVCGEFSPQQLVPFLNKHPVSGTIFVAFSGGVDSSALLHALAMLRSEGDYGFAVEAIHVNHGLQSESVQWGEHCQRFCNQLEVPLHLLKVDAKPKSGESPEESARKARYHAFAEQIQNGDQLFTAHHQEDQAETFLLQALRGAGPRGLSAMGEVVLFSEGELMRPLLQFSQQSLQEYALREHLEWVEDPTNQEQSADRNYIRHEILPRLKTRWTAAASTLSRSARHCAEASLLIETWSAEQLNGVAVGDPMPIFELEPVENRRARIRHWLEKNGAGLPDAVHLQRIIKEVIEARKDATPLVRWKNREQREVAVRRFQNLLYLVMDEERYNFPDVCVEWDLLHPMVIPELGVKLVGRRIAGDGIREELLQGRRVTVRSRVGGERCYSGGSKQRRTLKNLLRERAVPPWKRNRIPLVFVDDELAQVVGEFVCDTFAAGDLSDEQKDAQNVKVGLLIEVVPQG